MTNGGKTTTDFNKIAGAAPPMRKTVFDKAEERRIVKRYFPASSALRNEYDAADEAGKALMIVE